MTKSFSRRDLDLWRAARVSLRNRYYQALRDMGRKPHFVAGIEAKAAALLAERQDLVSVQEALDRCMRFSLPHAGTRWCND